MPPKRGKGTRRDGRIAKTTLGAIAIVLLVVVVVASSCGGSSKKYEIKLSGTFPHQQQVGVPEKFDAMLKNTGDAPMPNAALDLGEAKSWVIAAVVPQTAQNQGSSVYSFGPLNPGKSLHATFTLVPTDAGNPTFRVFAWGDIDKSTGLPKGHTEGIETPVAILP
jgi:hypothetical protein